MSAQTADMANRLTGALDVARAWADNEKVPESIVLPLDIYELLYFTALHARNMLRDLD